MRRSGERRTRRRTTYLRFPPSSLHPPLVRLGSPYAFLQAKGKEGKKKRRSWRRTRRRKKKRNRGRSPCLSTGFSCCRRWRGYGRPCARGKNGRPGPARRPPPLPPLCIAPSPPFSSPPPPPPAPPPPRSPPPCPPTPAPSLASNRPLRPFARATSGTSSLSARWATIKPSFCSERLREILTQSRTQTRTRRRGRGGGSCRCTSETRTGRTRPR